MEFPFYERETSAGGVGVPPEADRKGVGVWGPPGADQKGVGVGGDPDYPVKKRSPFGK